MIGGLAIASAVPARLRAKQRAAYAHRRLNVYDSQLPIHSVAASFWCVPTPTMQKQQRKVERMEIMNLKDCPASADIVADRGWNAWWTDSGSSLAEYRAHLEPMLAKAGVPFCLVAQIDGVYAGSVLVIENDLEARPQYTPWIAALWVEPSQRRKGVGESLLTAAYEDAARLGCRSCYLCATAEKDNYYLARGFDRLENDVGGLNVFIRRA